jgi:4-amino-4-deoxy-L-arabinose transferase-like glycosyltransferase
MGMSTTLKRWLDWLPLVVILAIGAYLRFYKIGELPPGLYRDEGFYGLDALGILRGHPAIYFAANNGREGLYMYILAVGIAFLGRTPEALRVVSACVGTLTILAIYAAGSNLFSRRVGLLSAAILASTFWHLTLSRVAYRAITFPLLLCIFVALAAGVLRGLRAADNSLPQRRMVVQAFAAGVAFGLTLYTYTSAQFLPILVLAVAILAIVLNALGASGYRLPAGRTKWTVALVALAGAVLVLAPFIVWLTRHPDLFFARAEQVSILSPIINKGDFAGTLWRNIVKAAEMFTIQGDRIWRHNLSLRPVFDTGAGVMFVIGVAACLWQFVKRLVADVRLRTQPHGLSYAFVLLGLGIFLIPTILAEDTPHYLRAIGALPVACIIAAVGLEAGLAWLSRRGLLNLYFGRMSRIIHPPALIAFILLAISTVTTYGDYFEKYVHQDMTAYWLEDNNVQLARTINLYTSANPSPSLWLDDLLSNDNPSLRFLSPDVELEHVSIVGIDRGIPKTTPNLLIVDPNHDWTRLRNVLPPNSLLEVSEGALAQDDFASKPRRAFISVRAEHQLTPTAGNLTFEQGIFMTQAGISSPDTSVLVRDSQLPITNDLKALMTASGMPAVYTITLYWSTSQPISDDLTVFVHWQRGGKVIAQNDSGPALGYLPMPTWRPGDVIMDEHSLLVPGGLQPGDEVQVGIYRRWDNIRLHLLDANGKPIADSALIVRLAMSGTQSGFCVYCNRNRKI